MEFKRIPGQLVMETCQSFLSNLVKDCDVTEITFVIFKRFLSPVRKIVT